MAGMDEIPRLHAKELSITLEELGPNQPISQGTHAEPEASKVCDPRPGFG